MIPNMMPLEPAPKEFCYWLLGYIQAYYIIDIVCIDNNQKLDILKSFLEIINKNAKSAILDLESDSKK